MTQAETTTACTHHWQIAEQDGSRERPGVCRHCGATRMFVIGEQDGWSARESRSRERSGDIARERARKRKEAI